MIRNSGKQDKKREEEEYLSGTQERRKIQEERSQGKVGSGNLNGSHPPRKITCSDPHNIFLPLFLFS
jgi:hypothetical protein